VQTVHDIRIDCDSDVVLLQVTQEGHTPGIACHTGRHSCFYQRLNQSEDGTDWLACEPVLKDPESIYK
jgi:phosphoribosyl-AMP cyclohydrolase